MYIFISCSRVSGASKRSASSTTCPGCVHVDSQDKSARKQQHLRDKTMQATVAGVTLLTKRENHNIKRPRHRHRRSFRQVLQMGNTKRTSVALLCSEWCVRVTPRLHQNSPSKLSSGTHADPEYNTLALNAAQRREQPHKKKQNNKTFRSPATSRHSSRETRSP